MSGEPITKITLDGGRTRYRVTLDIGADPATGRRRQRRATFDTLRAAWRSPARPSRGANTSSADA